MGYLGAAAPGAGGRRAQPNGRTVAYLEGALGNLGAMLEADPAARARLQSAAEAIVRCAAARGAGPAGRFHRPGGGELGHRTVVERLELRVGKDLQYVRVNGTLVGFLLGGAIFAAAVRGVRTGKFVSPSGFGPTAMLRCTPTSRCAKIR